jgi:hypothetical protein
MTMACGDFIPIWNAELMTGLPSNQINPVVQSQFSAWSSSRWASKAGN